MFGHLLIFKFHVCQQLYESQKLWRIVAAAQQRSNSSLLIRFCVLMFLFYMNAKKSENVVICRQISKRSMAFETWVYPSINRLLNFIKISLVFDKFRFLTYKIFYIPFFGGRFDLRRHWALDDWRSWFQFWLFLWPRMWPREKGILSNWLQNNLGMGRGSSYLARSEAEDNIEDETNVIRPVMITFFYLMVNSNKFPIQLSPPLTQKCKLRHFDSVTNVRTAFLELKVCSWINYVKELRL